MSQDVPSSSYVEIQSLGNEAAKHCKCPDVALLESQALRWSETIARARDHPSVMDVRLSGVKLVSPHGGITILDVKIGQDIREASNKQTVDFDWIA